MFRLGSFIFTDGFRRSCTGSGKRYHVVLAGVLYFHKWFSSQFCGLWKQRPCCQGWGPLCAFCRGTHVCRGTPLLEYSQMCDYNNITALSLVPQLFCRPGQFSPTLLSCPFCLRSCLTMEGMILVKHIWTGQRAMYPIFCLFRFTWRIISDALRMSWWRASWLLKTTKLGVGDRSLFLKQMLAFAGFIDRAL